jgi:site-specific recombinase XerC
MGFCFGKGPSGREPAAITIGSRIATISSFYRFLIRMEMLRSNPADALERPKHNPAPARGLSADDVKRLLTVIPDTAAGRRDRAIVLALVLTGRRRSEILDLRAKHIEVDDERAVYCYRGKGGKHPHRPTAASTFVRRSGLTPIWRTGSLG